MTRALFYTCCGHDDLTKAVEGFVDQIDVVHAADIGRRMLTNFDHDWQGVCRRSVPYAFASEWEPNGPEGIRWCDGDQSHEKPRRRREYTLIHRDTGRTLEFIWHNYDAVEALRQIPSISIFFARRDGSRDGEGASGICWLGDILLARTLEKLVSGGLFVTDGVRMGGEKPQAPLWRAPRAENPVGTRFTAAGRAFECIGVFDTQPPATLIWRVA